MNITLFSDLHLEFDKEIQPFHPGEGDILILAGDICTAADIKKDNPHGRMYRAFFNNCVRNYNKVFYVMGNHEHYGHNFSYTVEKLRSRLPTEITILDKEVVRYNDWYFMGATMWTDFNKQNPIAMMNAEMTMYDYRSIRYGPQYRKLRANDILQEHNKTMHWMETTLPELNDCPVFMITHHQPSYQSLSSAYRGSSTNPCYAVELHDFILAHPQIQYWVAGHTHVSNDYMIDQCRVLGNPRGYNGYELNPDFQPNFTLELQ